RTAGWAHRRAPLGFVSPPCRQSAHEISPTEPTGPNTPALLTSRSTRPHRRWTAPNSAATDSGTVMSVGAASADSAGHSPGATLSCSAWSRRPAAATCHPAERGGRVMHRPRPDPAPGPTPTRVVALPVLTGAAPPRRDLRQVLKLPSPAAARHRRLGQASVRYAGLEVSHA